MMEICGILPVIKPTGPTSHDVVDRVRRLFGTRRVGHTGTLDPLASGLLLLCLGRATKVAGYLSVMTKTYRATIRLGQRTTTGDAEGEVVDAGDTHGVDSAAIDDALKHFRGVITQRVPALSAVKVRGRRLYSYARRGQTVPEVLRQVEILQITAEKFNNPDLTINVCCAGGTYIRTLAEDIGNRLGCMGHLISLTRTHVGEFDYRAAERLDDLEELPTRDERCSKLRPIEEFLGFPMVAVGEDRVRQIRNGALILPQAIEGPVENFHCGDKIIICDPARRALAVGVANCNSLELAEDRRGSWFKYERVLI